AARRQRALRAEALLRPDRALLGDRVLATRLTTCIRAPASPAQSCPGEADPGVGLRIARMIVARRGLGGRSEVHRRRLALPDDDRNLPQARVAPPDRQAILPGHHRRKLVVLVR